MEPQAACTDSPPVNFGGWPRKVTSEKPAKGSILDVPLARAGVGRALGWFAQRFLGALRAPIDRYAVPEAVQNSRWAPQNGLTAPPRAVN